MSLPAVPTSLGEGDGLDDVEPTDLILPYIRIDHEAGCFVDAQTDENFETMKVIILGRFKQRALWPKEPGQKGDPPMCRSWDFETGHPNGPAWLVVQPKTNNITAQRESGFTMQEVMDASEPGESLRCNSCKLKEWGPNKTPPWCNEQYTMPIVRLAMDGVEHAPSLSVFTVSKTGLAPFKPYISGFAGAKQSLYTAETLISALVTSKGSGGRPYVVPTVKRVGQTDPSEWQTYSTTYHGIKEYMTQPREMRPKDPEDEVEDPIVQTPQTPVAEPVAPPAAEALSTPPVPAQATTEVTEQEARPPKRAAPAAATAPSAVADDEDEEPFS